jgi:hypothetical protein
MKINEIISNQVNEGFWDAMKAVGKGVTAAVTGQNGIQAGTQAYHQSTGEKSLAGMANSVMARWNKQVFPAIPPNLQSDPGTVKQYLDKFLGSYFAGDYSSNNTLASADPQEVGDYIRKAVNAEAAGMQVQAPPPPPPTGPESGSKKTGSVPAGFRLRLVVPNKGTFFKVTNPQTQADEWQVDTNKTSMENPSNKVDPSNFPYLEKQLAQFGAKKEPDPSQATNPQPATPTPSTNPQPGPQRRKGKGIPRNRNGR